jgi:hypothetical protein
MSNETGETSFNTSSSDNSWFLCENNVSDMSIISSQASEDATNSETMSISLRPDESLNASLEAYQTEPFTHLSSSVTMSPPKDTEHNNIQTANTIHDSYNLNINDVLPILSKKTSTKLESVLNAKQSHPTNNKLLFHKSVTAQNLSNFSSEANKKNDYIIRSSQETNPISSLQAKSNILDKLKSAKVDSMGSDLLSILSKKQKTFISDAKNAHDDSLKLNEEAKELNKLKKEIQLSAALNEQVELLQDSEDKFNYKLIKDGIHTEAKVKIVAPKHDEPKIDLANLLEANQTDAQLMISQIKEKNKDFIGTILD